MLINVKMPTIVDILTFISMIDTILLATFLVINIHLFYIWPFQTPSRNDRTRYILDPRCPIVSRGGSEPVFLRKHIVTCSFSVCVGCVRTPCPHPPGSAHDGNRPMIALQHIDSVTIMHLLLLCNYCLSDVLLL